MNAKIAVVAATILMIFVAMLVVRSPLSATPVLAYRTADPSFTGASANITLPPYYAVLYQYVLDVINVDRSSALVSPLALSAVESGQQHANSMLLFGYFSHWDTQGLKPYMRYSLLNGTGAVSENVAWQHQEPSSYSTLADLKSALVKMNLQMMYDDSFYNWEHRGNILDPNHSSVSLGISYDEHNVFLVEDFENSFVNLTSPLRLSDGTLRIEGETSLTFTLAQASVYLDASPVNLSVSVLRQNPQYMASYDMGARIGFLLPESQNGTTGPPGTINVKALSWQTGPGQVNLTLPMEPFIGSFGKGVYTVYLQRSDGQAILSYSFLA